MESRPNRVPPSAATDGTAVFPGDSLSKPSQVNTVTLHSPTIYRINNYHRHPEARHSSLVDRGANGSIIGANMRKVHDHYTFTHLNGIDDHTVRDLPLICAGGVAQTQQGSVILIVNQGAHMPDGKTILSPGQMEHFKWTVSLTHPTVDTAGAPSIMAGAP